MDGFDATGALYANHRLALGDTVDVTRAAALVQAARQAAADAGDVAVDCARVEQMDAAGVQVLLALSKSLGQQGRRLVVEHVAASLVETLTIAGAQELLGTASGSRP